jgi:hypothetical protein
MRLGKTLFYSIVFCSFQVVFSGCHTLSRTVATQLQSNAYGSVYPSASSTNTLLSQSPPTADLSQYKSAHARSHQNPEVAIAIAASGGGYRAANLTAGVLMGLESISDSHLQGNLLQEVDYFSTVSGGGFGVGYYIASLKNFLQTHDQSGPFAPQFSFTNTMNEVADDNSLDTDYTDKLFFDDNRNQEIERAFAASILKTKTGTLTLGDMFIPRSSPTPVTLPYWVTNSTIYQNAQIFPFTPTVLSKYGVINYPYDNHYYPVTNYYNIPAAVGMTASASFPFALTPTTLGSNACTDSKNCYLQLLDGGLADNLGVYTALDLLKQDPAKSKILIVIDAYAGQDDPFSKNLTPPSGPTLLWGVLGMGTNASRQILKRHINSMAKAQLCTDSTRKILVIYLDLENYALARSVRTDLFIPRTQQKLLLNIGQELVKNNSQFSQSLKPFLNPASRVGLCRYE